jgi:predicted alpha/beta-fold hydrolase
VKGNQQVLGGVGYSLGAIVLNQYVASYGERVALDVSVSISGAMDCTFQQVYRRSQRIWQSMIVTHMKDHYLYPKWGNRIFQQIGQENYQKLMRAGDIVVGTCGWGLCAYQHRSNIFHFYFFATKQDADTFIGVQYNGYQDHNALYSDMSAVLAANTTEQNGYFAIPHLVLQSFDDPVSTWLTNAANDPTSPLFSKNIVLQEKSRNLVVLLTKTGGHVGWPMGTFSRSWEYMNTLVAAGFVSSYVESVGTSSTILSLQRKDHESQVRPKYNATTMTDCLLPVVSLDRVCS